MLQADDDNERLWSMMAIIFLCSQRFLRSQKNDALFTHRRRRAAVLFHRVRAKMHRADDNKKAPWPHSPVTLLP